MRPRMLEPPAIAPSDAAVARAVDASPDSGAEASTAMTGVAPPLSGKAEPHAIVALSPAGSAAAIAADPPLAAVERLVTSDDSPIEVGGRVFELDSKNRVVARVGKKTLWRSSPMIVAGGLVSLAVSPKGRFVERTYTRGGIEVFDAASGRLLAESGLSFVIAPDETYALEPPAIALGASRVNHVDVRRWSLDRPGGFKSVERIPGLAPGKEMDVSPQVALAISGSGTYCARRARTSPTTARVLPHRPAPRARGGRRHDDRISARPMNRSLLISSALCALALACSKKAPEPSPVASAEAGFGLTFVPLAAPEAGKDPWQSPGCDYGDAPRCTRECEQENHGSCVNLAMMLIAGHGVPADQPRGRALLERSCEAKDGLACSNLGQLHEKGWGATPDFRRAADAYERGCTYGMPGACGNLGVLVAKGQGRPLDRSRGRTLLDGACAKGDTNACENLRTMPP